MKSTLGVILAALSTSQVAASALTAQSALDGAAASIDNGCCDIGDCIGLDDWKEWDFGHHDVWAGSW